MSVNQLYNNHKIDALQTLASDCTSQMQRNHLILSECIPMFYEKDEEKKAEIKAKLGRIV